jgi:hypothetical protein
LPREWGEIAKQHVSRARKAKNFNFRGMAGLS